MYLYLCYNEKNVTSRLSPQWLCGNSCTWAHDICIQVYIYKYSGSPVTKFRAGFN